MKLGGFIEQFGKAELQAQRGLLKIARLLGSLTRGTSSLIPCQTRCKALIVGIMGQIRKAYGFEATCTHCSAKFITYRSTAK